MVRRCAQPRSTLTAQQAPFSGDPFVIFREHDRRSLLQPHTGARAPSPYPNVMPHASASVTPTPDTRTAILREAALLFNQVGYTVTSVADILHATGLDQAALDAHFAGKDALALAAFDYAAALTHQRFADAVAQQQHPVDQLQAIVETFAGLATDPPLPGGCPVLNTALKSEDVYPGLRQRARALLDAWRGLIRRIVRTGIRHGEVHPGTVPDELASLLVATMEGAVLLSLICHHPMHVHHAARHLIRHLHEHVRA